MPVAAAKAIDFSLLRGGSFFSPSQHKINRASSSTQNMRPSGSSPAFDHYGAALSCAIVAGVVRDGVGSGLHPLLAGGVPLAVPANANPPAQVAVAGDVSTLLGDAALSADHVVADAAAAVTRACPAGSFQFSAPPRATHKRPTPHHFHTLPDVEAHTFAVYL